MQSGSSTRDDLRWYTAHLQRRIDDPAYDAECARIDVEFSKCSRTSGVSGVQKSTPVGFSGVERGPIPLDTTARVGPVPSKKSDPFADLGNFTIK